MTDTSQEHLTDLEALAVAIAATDRAIMQLIVNELAEAMPALDAAEDQAAAALREALTALGKPQSLLAGFDAEIDRVTGQCAEWQGRLSSLLVEDRVEARVRFQAWNDELDKLKEQRDQAERDLEPYRAAMNKARGDLELVQGAKRGLAWAMVTPYESPVGQGTKAYVSYRMPRLAYVLLAGDPSHREWEPAISQLEEMCLRSAYRTDHLPSNAEQMARAMTAAMPDAASAPFAPSPNAQEVMAADMVKLANEVAPPSKIDDYRGPGPRRAVPDRPYMRLPGAR